MFSLPYVLKSVAWIVPAGFMYGTAPTFILVWGGWRVATALLPNKIYEKGDDFLYSLYQKLVLFFFENCSGVKVSHVFKSQQKVYWLYGIKLISFTNHFYHVKCFFHTLYLLVTVYCHWCVAMVCYKWMVNKWIILFKYILNLVDDQGDQLISHYGF